MNQQTNKDEILIHSLKRKDGKIIAIGDDYKQGTIKEIRIDVYALTETGVWNINELEEIFSDNKQK